MQTNKFRGINSKYYFILLKVNNEQFGIDFDYSDDKYTTALNIDKVDKDLRKKAERIENVMLF
jgi:hypothetical protein